MNNQLSFIDDSKQSKEQRYRRVSNGQFATQEQAEFDRIKRERDYYKHMYEVQRSKNPSIIKLLRLRDEEIIRLKKLKHEIQEEMHSLQERIGLHY